jgi:hypothetical protein
VRAEVQSVDSPDCTLLRGIASLESAARRRDLLILVTRAVALTGSLGSKLPEPARAA